VGIELVKGSWSDILSIALMRFCGIDALGLE